MKIDTLIFDMDGVITTEEKYWACARLTLWELATQTLGLSEAFGDAVLDAATREAVIPDDLIYALKGRAVNSNWDIAFVACCIYMSALPEATVISAMDVPDLLEAIRDTISGPANWPQALGDFLAETHGAKGKALTQEAGNRLRKALDFSNEDLLRAHGPLWWYLHDRFQRFYSGEAMTEYEAKPLADGTVIPADQIEATLKRLRDTGYTLGAATGRLRSELDDALGGLGLLDYFDQKRLGTLDVVRHAEKQLGVVGLEKPHPFCLLNAIHPGTAADILLDEDFQKIRRGNVVVIGDSTSDVLMAKAGGCRAICVLTGVRGEAARQERHRLLVHAAAEAILDDMTHVPDWLEGQH